MENADLLKVIEAYAQATLEVQKTHESLRAQVARLSDELTRKNAELTTSLTEVSALKNYLANVLESNADGVIAIDPDRRVMAFNHSATQIVVSMSHDRLGRPIYDVLPQACQELGRLLIRSLEEQRTFTNVEITLSGTPRRILSVSVNPIRNQQGEILGAVQTFRDLTEIKMWEEKVAQQGRLAELGEMAAGVAHEIRNPLGGIELYASSLKRRLQENADAHIREIAIAEKISEAATTLDRIVTDMLTFARQRNVVRKLCDIAQVLRSAADMAIREREQKNITLDWRLAIGERHLFFDGDQLTQAALNVILNAVQFMQPHGRLIIDAHLVVSSDSEDLVIEFIDDGAGISEENRLKLFNPFFTTRQGGTGLGLAIVHKIITDHGGTVTAENRPPLGACFTFRLPIHHETHEIPHEVH